MLEDLWAGLAPADCETKRWAAVLDDLLARYGEEHRHYHTHQHLEEMAALLQRERARLQAPRVVFLAMFFHDAVLVSGARDNEEESAALARRQLDGWLEPASLARIEELVLATRSHESAPTDIDRTLLVDADMAILGAPRARYHAYARGIRAEYAHVPDELYVAGRGRFLEGILARPHIYGDPALRGELEQRARANLAAELSAGLG